MNFKEYIEIKKLKTPIARNMNLLKLSRFKTSESLINIGEGLLTKNQMDTTKTKEEVSRVRSSFNTFTLRGIK